jgi:hypothetical protein
MSLRITFAKPGFFITDARIVLLVDGQAIHDGSFLAGIDLRVPVAPGPHRLESVIDIGLARRRRAWDVIAPCEVEIEYSRFWGNFSKKARVTPTSGN